MAKVVKVVSDDEDNAVVAEVRDPRNQHPLDLVREGIFVTDMYFETVMVTGPMARDLLLYNREPEAGKESTNRKASLAVVTGYALTMLKGLWYLSPQPVIFSSREVETMSAKEVEELIDGQQRLKAVVLAAQQQPDIQVPLTLCFDAPSESKWRLDQGKRRTDGDRFRMAGEKDPVNLVKALRVLYPLEEMQPFKSIDFWRRLPMTFEEQAAFLARHEHLRHSLEVAKGMKTLVMPHIGAVLHYLVQREFGPYVAQELFNGLLSGASLELEDPRLRVREFLSKMARDRHKWDGFEQLAVLIAATNAWLTKQRHYKAALVFNNLSRTYPKLFLRSEMPQTEIVPGNDPALQAARRPVDEL